jgi:hypothetical protein
VIRAYEKGALIDIVIRDDGSVERIAVVEAHGYDIAVFIARFLHIGKRDIGDGVPVFFYRRHFPAKRLPFGRLRGFRFRRLSFGRRLRSGRTACK